MKRGMPNMGMGGMNINKLLKEAQKMQADLQKSQEEVTNKTFESTSGGGAVNVKISGAKRVLEIKLSDDLVNSQDKEMMEDLILVCLNDVIAKVENEEKQITDGLNLPGFGF